MAKQPDSWHQHVISNMPKMEAGPVTSLTPGPGPTSSQPVNVGFQSLQPGFDVIDLLPPAAAEKLRMLRQHRDDAYALVPEFEQVRQASLTRIEAANALKRLTDHPQDGGFNLPDGNRSVITAKRTLEKATDEFERLKQLQEVRAAAFQSASAALAACEDWLRVGKPGGVVLQDHEAETPKLQKGEDVLSGIERLRRRCRELKADQHRIASAPYPSSYAKQRMRAQIEALAMQGAPSVSALIELDGKVEFQTQRITSEIHSEQRSLGFAQVPDTLALVAWLHRDVLIAALDREISTEADDPAALSHEQRQQAEAQTMGDLLDIERQEASLVWMAQAQGLPCEHRADCAVLAILGCGLITVARPANGPSSPEHAYDILHPGSGRR
jgi:hypothetical protein